MNAFRVSLVGALTALVFGAALVLDTGVGQPGSAEAATCIGDGLAKQDKVRKTTAVDFAVCSDPGLMMVVSLQWSGSSKDLGLRITQPGGAVTVVDHHVGSTEGIIFRATLPEGDWKIEVFNNGGGTVAYTLDVGMVPDPAK